MPTLALPVLSPALPEILLACGAMALLLIGVFRGEGSARLVSWLAVALLIAVLVVSGLFGGERRIGFYGMFVTDAFAVFMKALVLIGSAVSIILSLHYNEEGRIARFEFPVLILLATTGMMVMVSANDLITLYLGLELQSLALYVVASFDRDSVRSTEAGLKYFVLGALALRLVEPAAATLAAWRARDVLRGREVGTPGGQRCGVGAVDIPNLTVIFDDGDRFMDNYTVQSAGACKVDKGLPGLTCGKVATGADLKVTITAQPSKAGSFVFKFHLANNKQRLHQSDDNEYVYSWTQTVTAA